MSLSTDNLRQAQRLTAHKLASLLQAESEELTRMRLSEVQELADEVARVLPAGNVVAMVFSQLSAIKGKQTNGKETRQMLNLLQQGMSTFMDKATYLAFYTTPAILISGYQQLLELAGKDPNAAFPNGTWQFYLEFGLREDTARHTCETRGFHHSLAHISHPREVDQLAAWIMALAWLVANYDQLVMQEWRERMTLRKLAEHTSIPRITTAWVRKRPYAAPLSREIDYLAYRGAAFDAFVIDILEKRLHDNHAEATLQSWYQDETLLRDERVNYRDQMTILATLEPEDFNDQRLDLPIEHSEIAVYLAGKYHMIPVLHHEQLLDATIIRTLAQSILNSAQTAETPPDEPYVLGLDEFLVHIPRGQQGMARRLIPQAMLEDFDRLRTAPVILNWDMADVRWPLSVIRQGRRGFGDHALTVFRTDESMVFDQSHIFFDAIWGMAVSEIVTNQAIHFLKRMEDLPLVKAPSLRPTTIDLMTPDKASSGLRRLVSLPREISAEISFNMDEQFQAVREALKQRHNELRLTVNDFLILYRALHNQRYEPSVALIQTLQELSQMGNSAQRAAADSTLEQLRGLRHTNPAFLIPIDATALDPKERIYPVTFRPQAPWTDLGVQHALTWQVRQTLKNASSHRDHQLAWNIFSEERTKYLEMLRMFNLLMLRYKEVALAGQSFSTRTLKILASVPKRLQSWLNHIPDRIDLLNDMLKGTEVFSNVGRVADSSSLSRFMTAKDDNEKKVLCWGIMTRADNTMVITLRDFRPWVVALRDAGVPHIAQLVTQDFLDGYVEGLYHFLSQLNYIVTTTVQE